MKQKDKERMRKRMKRTKPKRDFPFSHFFSFVSTSEQRHGTERVPRVFSSFYTLSQQHITYCNRLMASISWIGIGVGIVGAMFTSRFFLFQPPLSFMAVSLLPLGCCTT